MRIQPPRPYPMQLGVLEPVCECHTCQPLPRTMKAVPPLDVRFPPSMRQEYESPYSSSSVPYSLSQSSMNSEVCWKPRRHQHATILNWLHPSG